MRISKLTPPICLLAATANKPSTDLPRDLPLLFPPITHLLAIRGFRFTNYLSFVVYLCLALNSAHERIPYVRASCCQLRKMQKELLKRIRDGTSGLCGGDASLCQFTLPTCFNKRIVQRKSLVRKCCSYKHDSATFKLK